MAAPGNAMCLIYTPTNEHFGIVPPRVHVLPDPCDCGGRRRTYRDYVSTESQDGSGSRKVQISARLCRVSWKTSNTSGFKAFGEGTGSKTSPSMHLAKIGKFRYRFVQHQAMEKGSRSLAQVAVAFHFALAVGILYYMTLA